MKKSFFEYLEELLLEAKKSSKERVVDSAAATVIGDDKKKFVAGLKKIRTNVLVPLFARLAEKQAKNRLGKIKISRRGFNIPGAGRNRKTKGTQGAIDTVIFPYRKSAVMTATQISDLQAFFKNELGLEVDKKAFTDINISGTVKNIDVLKQTKEYTNNVLKLRKILDDLKDSVSVLRIALEEKTKTPAKAKTEINTILKQAQTEINAILKQVQIEKTITTENRGQLLNEIGQVVKEIKTKLETTNKNFEIASAFIDRMEGNQGLFVVMSYNTAAVARQSTNQSWSSCMNLYTGVNKKFVGPGILAGSFVAYLIQRNAPKPIARVLVKPMKNKEGNIFWYVDKVYAGEGAKGAAALKGFVAELLKQENLEIPEGKYSMAGGTYVDTEGSMSIDDAFKMVQRGEHLEFIKKIENLLTKSKKTAEEEKFISDSKKTLEKLIEKYPKEVFLNLEDDVVFPDITVKNLDLSNVDLRSFPKGIKVTDNLNLSGTNITEIFA